MSDTLMSTYAPLPVTFEKGDGVWLWDTEGKQYLDALSGIAVCGLGRTHPAVTKAICEQAGTLIHTTNIYAIQHQQALADKLTKLADMDSVFFGNSGAEAIEGALRLARHATGRDEFVALTHSFHGRTYASLSITGNSARKKSGGPFMPGVAFARLPRGKPSLGLAARPSGLPWLSNSSGVGAHGASAPPPCSRGSAARQRPRDRRPLCALLDSPSGRRGSRRRTFRAWHPADSTGLAGRRVRRRPQPWRLPSRPVAAAPRADT